MKDSLGASGADLGVRTIIAQLEAASTLLKFAADDLESYADRADTGVRDSLRGIVRALQKNAASLFENALYLDRVEQRDDEDEIAGWPLPSPARRASQA